MKNQEIQQEMFALQPFDVVKAAYKDSVYYIAGEHDITGFVSNSITEDNAKQELQAALKRFLEVNPKLNVLKVPLQDFVLLDDPTTTAKFVVMFCYDVLNYSEEKSNQVVHELNTVGYHHVGTYTDELAMTLGHLLEESNAHRNENLKWDKVERSYDEVQYNKSMALLETLIRRDYPTDL